MRTGDLAWKMLQKLSRVTEVTPESFAEAGATEQEEVIRVRERQKEKLQAKWEHGFLRKCF